MAHIKSPKLHLSTPTPSELQAWRDCLAAARFPWARQKSWVHGGLLENFIGLFNAYRHLCHEPGDPAIKEPLKPTMSVRLLNLCLPKSYVHERFTQDELESLQNDIQRHSWTDARRYSASGEWPRYRSVKARVYYTFAPLTLLRRVFEANCESYGLAPPDWSTASQEANSRWADLAKKPGEFGSIYLQL
jgi:hypothetical protein